MARSIGGRDLPDEHDITHPDYFPLHEIPQDLGELIPDSAAEEADLRRRLTEAEHPRSVQEIGTGLAIGEDNADLTDIRADYLQRTSQFWTLPVTDHATQPDGFRAEAEQMAWLLYRSEALAAEVDADRRVRAERDEDAGGSRADDPTWDYAILKRAQPEIAKLWGRDVVSGFSHSAARAVEEARQRAAAAPTGEASAKTGSGPVAFDVDLVRFAAVRDELDRTVVQLRDAIKLMAPPVRTSGRRAGELGRFDSPSATATALDLHNVLVSAYYDLTVTAVRIGTSLAAVVGGLTQQLAAYQGSQDAAAEDMLSGLGL